MTIDINELRKDKRPQSSTVVHALLDRLEAAEKERDKLKELNIALCRNSNSQLIHNARLAAENYDLRAKIEAMERQKPVGKFTQHPSNGLWEQDGYGDNPDARPLYALPGAQPAPSVPMDVIADYLVSISAHLARRDDAKAQAEIGELLKMIAAAPKPEAKP